LEPTSCHILLEPILCHRICCNQCFASLGDIEYFVIFSYENKYISYVVYFLIFCQCRSSTWDPCLYGMGQISLLYQ
jgi:hypothetical protein